MDCWPECLHMACLLVSHRTVPENKVELSILQGYRCPKRLLDRSISVQTATSQADYQTE